MAGQSPRQDFPLLNSLDIAYFDNAATTHKPQAVLDAVDAFYERHNANVHRGIHRLAEEATTDYEHARKRVAKEFAAKAEEVVFTSGATHSLNLAAKLLESQLARGDEILTTVAEHHSLFVPMQQLAKRIGCSLVVVPLDEDQSITEAHISKYVTDETKVIAIASVSNVLGYALDVGKIRKHDAILLVDAAQALGHEHCATLKDADLIAVSAHKAYGPMGVGALIARRQLLGAGEPLLFGGSMIGRVTQGETTWAAPPARYEAGTPNVAGAVGFAAALDYLADKRKDASRREREVARKAQDLIATYATVIGPADKTAPIVSFVVPGVHAHDVAQVLDGFGVAVRAGQHCCEPLHDALGLDATVRVSVALYNDVSDVAKLADGLKRVREVFR